MSQVLVLGGRPGNIGDAIYQKLAENHIVTNSDCFVERIGFQVPDQRWFDLVSADHLVCTLGAMHIEPFDEVSELNITKVIHGSLIMPLLSARRFINTVQSGGGRYDEDGKSKIVFVGSYAHDHALSNSAAYCAAKAGLNAAVRELAWELTEHNFFFHIVNPYHVPDTPMGKDVFQSMIMNGMTAVEAKRKQDENLRMPGHLTALEIAEMVELIIDHSAMEWTAGTPINMYGGTR